MCAFLDNTGGLAYAEEQFLSHAPACVHHTERKIRAVKIAAAYENGMVCPRFSDARQFKIYTIEDERITSTELVDTDGTDSAVCLKQHGAGMLVCGKIANDSYMQLMMSGIAVFAGAAGEADIEGGILTTRMLHPKSSDETTEKGCDSPTCDGTSCEGCSHCTGR